MIERWSNKSKPTIGGVFILLAMIYPLYLFNFDIMVCFIILFVIGLMDDIGHCSIQARVLIQIFIGVVTVGEGYRLNWFSYELLDIALTIIFIVGIINAFNLIDNMDGALGIISAVSAIGFFIILNENMLLFFIIGILVFLIFNLPKAKIWMGDCGSLPVGYLFAIFSLMYHESNPGFSFVPLFLLAFPIIDTVYVMIKRTIKKQKFWIGGTDHLAHEIARFFRDEVGTISFLFIFQSIWVVSAWLIYKS